MRSWPPSTPCTPRALVPDFPRPRSASSDLDSWPQVDEDPIPFLATGLCSAAWLDRHLPALAAASAAARIDGSAVLHFDVRSDNLCIRDGRAMLVDWNHACIGNPTLDIASWLPSLQAEGGARPEEILPDDTPGLPESPSLLAGYFCARAGLPAIPQAPHVRPLQLAQARTALPWAARLLVSRRPRRPPSVAPATRCYYSYPWTPRTPT